MLIYVSSALRPVTLSICPVPLPVPTTPVPVPARPLSTVCGPSLSSVPLFLLLSLLSLLGSCYPLPVPSRTHLETSLAPCAAGPLHLSTYCLAPPPWLYIPPSLHTPSAQGPIARVDPSTPHPRLINDRRSAAPPRLSWPVPFRLPRFAVLPASTPLIFHLTLRLPAFQGL